MDEAYRNDSSIEEKWHSLATLLNCGNPVFDRTLILFGYDFSSNIYLLQGDYLSLIDSGNDYTAFMQLFDLGFKPPDIKKIALTHGHTDHVMGTVELFRGYRGYGQLDLEIILHEAGPQQFKEIAQQLGCRLTEVRGGEIINLSGLELEVIHTPGHTLDGLCFYHEPTGALFSGDTVLPHAMAEIDTAGGGRLDHYLYALRTLMQKEVRHVLPGHGGVAPHIGRRVMEETYEGLIKKMVGVETPWMDGVTTLAQQGLLREALFYCHKELAANPDNFPALETKAYLLCDLGRNHEAVAVFDEILAQPRDHLYSLMGKGTALMGLEQYQESLDCFDQALSIKPDFQEAQISKGLALFLAGKPEEAMNIEAFRRKYTGKVREFLQKSPSGIA